MSNLKRARDEMTNSDDDEPTMGKQILPVARLPANFSGEPMDGMQYLFMVRRDARQLPNVTRVENPYAKTAPFASPQTTTVRDARAGARIALPSEGWRITFLRRFKNFRKNIQQMTMGVSLPPPGQTKLMPNRKERDHWWAFISGLPEHDWNPSKKMKKLNKQQLRIGNAVLRPSAHSDETSQYEVTYTESADIEEGAESVHIFREDGRLVENVHHDDAYAGDQSSVYRGLPGGTHSVMGEAVQKQDSKAAMARRHEPRQPSLALLKSMDSRYCTHLLMYFAYWLSQHLEQLKSPDPLLTPTKSMRIARAHACWMFALLANVDEQISSDEISNLRSLARGCLTFIKELNKNSLSPDVLGTDSSIAGSEEVSETDVGNSADAPLDEKSCWIIITAIADLWGQRDLWMDAEHMLNRS